MSETIDALRYPEATKEMILYYIKINESRANAIYRKISKSFSDKIQSGKVTPPLKETTIRQKMRRGYKNPTYPLMATGQLSTSLFLDNFTDESITIASESKVAYHWHTTNRAWQVPERIVLNEMELYEAIEEGLSESLGYD